MNNLYKIIMAIALSAFVTGLAFADDKFKFKAGLSGAQSVPEVVTDTSGKLELAFNKSFSQAKYVLIVKNGVEIFAAHLHCARAGENGGVVAPLYTAGVIDVHGVLAEGVLANADIQAGGACLGVTINNIASLFSAARDGLIYVNVHSLDNPTGEARGQLFRGK